MSKLANVVNGSVVSCKYPRHGTRNILCARLGEVIRSGESVNGPYLTIKCKDGTYRTLRHDRMIDPVIVS